MVAPNPYEYIDGSNPPSGEGQFQYFTGTLKEAIQSSLDGDVGSPFTNVKIGGSKDYQTDNRLELINHDIYGKTSGFVSLTMASGWQGLFYLKSENNNFFEANAIDETIYTDWLTGTDETWAEHMVDVKESLKDQWPSIWVQDNAAVHDSRTVFGLAPGDHMSFDIDSQSSSVGQAVVKIQGVDYLNNAEIDNELYITTVWLRYWNPDQVTEPDTDPNVCALGQKLNQFGICVIDQDYVPPDPDPDPEPGVCPLGQKLNQFGICVIDEDYVTPPPPTETPEDDVSAFAMIMLLVGIGLIVSIALKVRA